MKKKLFIVTTVPDTFYFFKGQIQVLKKLFDVSLVSSSGKNLKDTEVLEKVSTHVVEMKREISFMGDLKSLYDFIVLFKRTKPYLVHGNTPKGGLLSITAAWLCGVPKRVYCIHGLRYEGSSGLKGLVLKTMERITCFFASDIVTVSYGVAETLKKDMITTKNANVIANGSINGIKSEYFKPGVLNVKALSEAIGLKKEDLVFGFVGRLVKDKGINELIEAFVALSIKHPHIRLLLVGYMEEVDPLLEFTKEQIANNPNIKFVGLQMDIRPYLQLMDVFTFPSYREGFGISIMEAAAMGIPSIASDINGCNEIIKDGYNGKLIPSKSVKHLKNTMELFIKHPAYINDLASNSRNLIIEKYDQKLVWKAIYDFYKKMI